MKKQIFAFVYACLIVSCNTTPPTSSGQVRTPSVTLADYFYFVQGIYSTVVTVTNDGGAPVTERGVVWNTSSSPTIALPTKIIYGTGIGMFTINIPGFISGSNYYIRAYATNIYGTSYSDEQHVTIP